jgi:hypothetical protein
MRMPEKRDRLKPSETLVGVQGPETSEEGLSGDV